MSGALRGRRDSAIGPFADWHLHWLIVGFQKITRHVTDTSFQEFYNHERLRGDERFRDAVLNTATITIIALPLKLVLGLALSRLFLDNFPGRQILIALAWSKQNRIRFADKVQHGGLPFLATRA